MGTASTAGEERWPHALLLRALDLDTRLSRLHQPLCSPEGVEVSWLGLSCSGAP